MYGHQFYQFSISKRVEYINSELQSGRFETLEALAADIFVDIGDLKEEFRRVGYLYVQDLNMFKRIEIEKAG